MNKLQELLKAKPVTQLSEGGLKATNVDFNCPQDTGIATLTADFDINKIISEGKPTSSGAERFANVTIRIAGMPIRFTGNCFVKVK